MIFTITLTEDLQLAHAVPPTVSSITTTTTTTIDVVFSSNIDSVNAGVTSTWLVDGVEPASVSDITAGSSDTITLTVAGGNAWGTDGTPTVQYTLDGGVADNNIFTSGGTQPGDNVANFGPTAATDGLSPVFVSAATTSTTTIDITFSEDIVDTASGLADYTINGVAGGSDISAKSVTGSILTITTNGYSMLSTETITITTVFGANELEDTGTLNDVASFGPSPVTNNIAAPTPETPKKGGGGCSGDCQEPTLGVLNDGRRLVDNGFTYNRNPIDVERFFTPYPLVTVEVGKRNVAEFKIYENGGPDKVVHFELAFGLGKGESIDKAQATIIWDKSWNGIEKTDIYDPTKSLDDVDITTSEVYCQVDGKQKCLLIKIVHTFRAPLEFNVLGSKVWDIKRNSWQNYYNHGIEVEGESLNPRLTKQIPGPDKHEGLITVAQSELYSDLWVAEDGRVFEFFGTNDSFRLLNPDVKRHEDTGDMKNRYHSSFNEWKEFQAELATSVFDSSVIQGMDPTFFAYDFPEVDTRTQFLIDNDMLELTRR